MAIACGQIKTAFPLVVALAQDFAFLGGSLGMSAGDGFIAAARAALKREAPLVVFTASGGARMQEGTLSLMQMARTTLAIEELKQAGLPYIVVLTDPTTGGVTASYAMLGDIQFVRAGGARWASPARASSSRPSARPCPPASSAPSSWRTKASSTPWWRGSDLPARLGAVLGVLMAGRARASGLTLLLSSRRAAWRLIRDPSAQRVQAGPALALRCGGMTAASKSARTGRRRRSSRAILFLMTDALPPRPAPLTPIDRLAAQSADYHRMEGALAWLAVRWRERPLLDDAAAAVDLSPFHFQRIFTRWAGVSPKTFMAAIAHAEARRLLEDGDNVLNAALRRRLFRPLAPARSVHRPGGADPRRSEEARRRGGADLGFRPDARSETACSWRRRAASAASPSPKPDGGRYRVRGHAPPLARRRLDPQTTPTPALTAAKVFGGPNTAKGGVEVPLVLMGPPFQVQIWKALAAHPGRPHGHLRPGRRPGRARPAPSGRRGRPSAPTPSACSSPATAPSPRTGG